MIRSGFIAAARRDTRAKGHARASLQSWIAAPFSRQPVSPKIRIRFGAAAGMGRTRAPMAACLAPAGKGARHRVTGKAALGPARNCMGTSRPSMVI